MPATWRESIENLRAQLLGEHDWREPAVGTRICDDLDREYVDDGIRDGWMIDAGTSGRLETLVDDAVIRNLPWAEYVAILDALQQLVDSPRPGITVWEEIDPRMAARRWVVVADGVPSITSLVP